MALLTTMKGLPLAYNKDMQEDKEGVFDAVDTLGNSLVVMTGMIRTLKVNEDAMRTGALGGFMAATDLADYLVGCGVPFREAQMCIRDSSRVFRRTRHIGVHQVAHGGEGPRRHRRDR